MLQQLNLELVHNAGDIELLHAAAKADLHHAAIFYQSGSYWVTAVGMDERDIESALKAVKTARIYRYNRHDDVWYLVENAVT